MPIAAGSFEVKLTPLPADERPDATFLGRLAIDKTFLGELAATSAGQMMAYRDAARGAAVYVALERVTGTLAGRPGSFILQHAGQSARGEQSLTITVVTDSGTDGLTGLTGAMAIVVADGKHTYSFDYILPAS